MSFNFDVQAGTSVKFPVGGKYCDRDIVVSATGTLLPDLSNPAGADEIVTGYEAIDKEGAVITGTNPYAKAATDAAVEDIATAITNKGVEVPSGTTLDGMAALIDGIESGGGLAVAYTTPTSGVTYTEGIADLDAETISLFSALISNNSNITNETTDVYIDYGKKHWKISVGNQIMLRLNGTDYAFDIIGFNHDELTDPIPYGFKTETGKAGMTLQMHDLFATTYQMKTSASNSGGWDGTNMFGQTMKTMHAYLANTGFYYDVKNVNKVSGTGGGSSSGVETVTDNKCFLLAEIEIFGKTTKSVAGEGTQYAYYKAGNSKVKKKSGSAYEWWSRSPVSGDSSTFCYISSAGAASYGNSYYKAANTYMGVSFAFCV